MSFGKASAPAPPDYTPIAQANAAAADRSFQLGSEQLQWGKDQFNTVWPYAQQYLNSQTAATNAEQKSAQDQQGFYDTTYKPIERQFATEASSYNSPARAEQRAGAAMADVSNQFAETRDASLRNLESYGIDPSQTRFGALDLSTRISQAAAMASAGTQSRLNSEATGLALQGEAINIGRGYPGAIATAYNTATNAGSSGINTANNTAQTGSNITGTPTSYLGLGNQSLGNQALATHYGATDALGSANLKYQIAANQASGIGNLVGGALTTALLI